MPENFCPQHGPYDASYGVCPYCSGGGAQRPAAPRPLGEADDQPTDLGYGQATAPTLPPGAGSGEEATEIPSNRASPNFLDVDDEEPTQVGRAPQEDVTQLEHAPIGAVGILWVREGPRKGQMYKIKGGTTIGRKEGDLILEDPKVSSLHAKFTIEDDEFTLWDFGSANGTWINGKRVRQATRLYENDSIKIGDTIFVLKLLDPKARRRATVSTKGKKPAKRSSRTKPS